MAGRRKQASMPDIGGMSGAVDAMEEVASAGILSRIRRRASAILEIADSEFGGADDAAAIAGGLVYGRSLSRSAG